jgi:hypothetical protein
MAYWMSNPGHSWLVLNEQEKARVPAFALRPDYEEDSEWALAVMALPELAGNPKLFNGPAKATLELARTRCRDWYPDEYELFTGEKATPENSLKRAEEAFNTANARNWVVIAAFGDWKPGVPSGYVEVIATLGGARGAGVRERTFHILKEQYDQRGRFGYVIQGHETEVTLRPSVVTSSHSFLPEEVQDGINQ